VKDLNNENYKTLKRGREEDTRILAYHQELDIKPYIWY
jgi:hypothetical protein